MTKSNKILLCTLLALVMTFACALTMLPVAKTTANAEEKSIVLTFPDDNKENNKIGAYDKSWEAKVGNYSWNITSFNNNSWNSWTYIKTGSKNSAVTGEILTKIDKPIKSIVITVDNIASDAVDSSMILTSKKDDFSESERYSFTIANGTNTIDFNTPTVDLYYKIVINCKKTSNNGTVQISKVEYKYDDAPTSSSALKLTGTLGAVDGSSKIEEINGTNTLVLGAESTFDVVYAIESATDIWGVEATIVADDNYLTIAKITAGDELATDENVTISGDSETVKKIVTTGNLATYAGKNFVTVTYKLKDGATEVPASAYGLTVSAVGGDGAFVAADKATATVTEMPIKVVQTTEIKINNTVEYTASALTVGNENSDIIVTTDHPGEMTATWVDGDGNALADQNIVNAGSYKLKLAFAANGIYAAQVETFDVTVTPAVLSNGKYVAKNGFGTKYVVSGTAVTWDNADEFVVSFDGLKGDDKLENIGALTIVTPVTLETEDEDLVELKFTITSDNYVFAENKKENTDEVVVYAKTGGIKIEGKPEEATVYYGTTIAFDGLKAVNVVTNETVDATFTLTIRSTLNGAIVETITGADVATYKLVNAGEYYVDIKAVATETTLGEAESANNHYVINKLNLTAIELDYTTDGKVTWTAPKYYTDDIDAAKELAELAGVTAEFTYKVNDGEAFTATEYAPTATADSLTITVLCNNANFVLPQDVTTKAVVSVTFVDEKNDAEDAASIATQYRFEGQKATAPTAPTYEGWTFKGWFVEETEYDFATALTASITLSAKWDENIVNCTLTIVNVYGGETTDTTNVLENAYAGKTNIADIGELANIALKKFVKVAGYYTDEACTIEATIVPNTTTATIYAKYVLAIADGDVNGDGTFDNNDIVLYRQYIVGGYSIEVVGNGDEYLAAELYADDENAKLFFCATANVNGDADEAGKDVCDIRDAAVMAMAMVNAGGYGVDNGTLTKPTTNASASTAKTTEAKQYALLPVIGKFAA